jgi:transposase-like protein
LINFVSAGSPQARSLAIAGNYVEHRREQTCRELAERLGNVAEACRRGGIDRTSFYDWKRRFQLEGLDGLKDLPPIAKSHPMTMPPEVVARIEALALLHPAYGRNRLETLLALEGRRLSAITIQKILNDKGLGTRHERWLALERHNTEQVQADLDVWLHHYNHERPHLGYRTQGRRPWETVERFVGQSSARQ